MRNSFVIAIGREVIVENGRVKTENCLRSSEMFYQRPTHRVLSNAISRYDGFERHFFGLAAVHITGVTTCVPIARWRVMGGGPRRSPAPLHGGRLQVPNSSDKISGHAIRTAAC